MGHEPSLYKAANLINKCVHLTKKKKKNVHDSLSFDICFIVDAWTCNGSETVVTFLVT